MVGKGFWCGCSGGWGWVFLWVMCWGSGFGGLCVKGFGGFRKWFLKKYLCLGWWDILL